MTVSLGIAQCADAKTAVILSESKDLCSQSFIRSKKII